MNKFDVTCYRWVGGDTRERKAISMSVTADRFEVETQDNESIALFYNVTSDLIAAITNFDSVIQVSE